MANFPCLTEPLPSLDDILARTGDGMMDRGGVWVDLVGLQELLVLEDQVHEILVLTDEMDHASQLSAAVGGALGDDLLVRTWKETDPLTAQMAGFQTLSIGIARSKG